MIHRLVPAYGRDYKSKAAVIEAFNKGKDFTICNIHDPYDGKPINKEQIPIGDLVNIRYSKLQRVAVFTVEAQ